MKKILSLLCVGVLLMGGLVGCSEANSIDKPNSVKSVASNEKNNNDLKEYVTLKDSLIINNINIKNITYNEIIQKFGEPKDIVYYDSIHLTSGATSIEGIDDIYYVKIIYDGISFIFYVDRDTKKIHEKYLVSYMLNNNNYEIRKGLKVGQSFKEIENMFNAYKNNLESKNESMSSFISEEGEDYSLISKYKIPKNIEQAKESYGYYRRCINLLLAYNKDFEKMNKKYDTFYKYTLDAEYGAPHYLLLFFKNDKLDKIIWGM